jgi:hypothetical protein
VSIQRGGRGWAAAIKGEVAANRDAVVALFDSPRDEALRDATVAWMESNPGKSYLSAIVLMPLLAVLVFSQIWLPEVRLERGGREMVAVVLAVHPKQVTVEYTVGSRTFTNRTGLPYDAQNDVHPGDTIGITYLPSEPGVLHTGPRPHDILPGVAAMAGSIALMAAVVWFFPMYLIPARKLRKAATRAAERG